MKSNTLILSDSRSILVSRMKWKQALTFAKLFTETAQHLAASGKLTATTADPLEDMAGKLHQILTHSDPLLTYLVMNSTKLTVEEADQLEPLDALNIINAAIEANFDPETRAGVVAMGETIAALFKPAA